MRNGAVSVGAIALEPLFVLTERIVDPHKIAPLSEFPKRRLHHGRKQQPVVRSRRNDTRTPEQIRCQTAGPRIQLCDQLVRSPDKPMGKKGGIHQKLRMRNFFGTPEIIRRIRIDCGTNRPPNLLRVFRTHPPSEEESPESSTQGAIPVISRPNASIWEQSERSSSVVVSTGMERFSSPRSSASRTGSAIRRRKEIHSSRIIPVVSIFIFS